MRTIGNDHVFLFAVGPWTAWTGDKRGGAHTDSLIAVDRLVLTAAWWGDRTNVRDVEAETRNERGDSQ